MDIHIVHCLINVLLVAQIATVRQREYLVALLFVLELLPLGGSSQIGDLYVYDGPHVL